MIEVQVVGPIRVAGTARACARDYGLAVSSVREAHTISRLLPPTEAGTHVTLLWCASIGQGDLEPLAEHIARLKQRRPGVVLLGVPARPPGPVTVMLSSRPTGQKAERETPRPQMLPAELGASVIEVDGGPHTGLRRFLRCFAGSLLSTGSVTRVTPLALADLLASPSVGRMVFWRVGPEVNGTILLRPPSGALPELRDPRATAALIHLRCPDRIPVSTVQETALCVEDLVVDRADALLTTTSSKSRLGDIEVHAAIFRPALAARLKEAMRSAASARSRKAQASARHVQLATAAEPGRPAEALEPAPAIASGRAPRKP